LEFRRLLSHLFAQLGKPLLLAKQVLARFLDALVDLLKLGCALRHLLRQLGDVTARRDLGIAGLGRDLSQFVDPRLSRFGLGSQVGDALFGLSGQVGDALFGLCCFRVALLDRLSDLGQFLAALLVSAATCWFC